MTPRTKNILRGNIFVLVALLLVLPVQWSYCMALAMPGFTADGCVAAMVAGLAATICLAGAIIFWNQALAQATPVIWYLRLLLLVERRIVAIMQLATMGLAIGAALVLIFHLPIPTHL